MAQNRKYDDFDFDRFDVPAEEPKAPAADGIGDFDIFNFSASELDTSGLGRVQDDLDLDSFLDFDNLLEPDAEPASEPEPESTTEPTEEELAYEQERASKRRQRRERKEAAFAELFGEPESAEEAAAETAEEPEAEYEPEPPKKRKREKSRKRDRYEDEAEPVAAEPVEQSAPETKAMPEEPIAEPFEEPVEEYQEPVKPKKRGLFGRRRRDEYEDESVAEEPETEEESIAAPEADIAPEELAAEPVEEPVEEYQEPVKAKKRGLFGRRCREEYEEEPADTAVEPESADDPATPPEIAAEPEAPVAEPLETEVPAEDASTADAETIAEESTSEPEEGPRKGFFARFLKSSEVQDEDDDDAPLDEPDEDEGAKPSLFRALFGRGKDEPDEAEEADEAAEEPAEKPAGEKISFFARLTPEKEKFQALMQAKKAEEKTARHTEIMAADNASLSQQLGRDPRRSEMLVYDSELDEISYIDRDDMPESRDYLPVRFRRYGRSGIGGGLMYAVFVISVSIVLACFGWLCAADVLALSKDEISAVIVVESYVPQPDDTLNEDGEPVDERGDKITCDIDQVSTALKDNDIINFKFLFQLFAKLSHASAKIDPGTYDVSTRLDYRALITEMQTGSDSQEITKITFPEGYRMEQIFELLEDNDICSYDDLMEAAAEHDYSYSWLDEAWYHDAKGDPTRLEGYLFPDTYEFYQGENAINVINRFLLRFHGLLTQDMYQQAENLGLTLHDAVIVASLIEREAGANDDRSNFSSAIYNRLNAGWKLQLDSTINYIQNTSTFNISYADLETDSPYNTYMYEGLPKGPICNAGLASLNAALNPNSTNYWFWYAYDGSTYFFTNSSDFNSFADAHPYN